MAPTDASLKADQVQAVVNAGMKAVVSAPLIYLIDMAVTITAHEDGRTAMIEVLANDADESGERPPVAGAQVRVSGHTDTEGHLEVLSRATTDAGGTCGLPLPGSIAPEDLFVTVEHDDYN